MKSATTKTGSISWTLRLFTLLVWLLVGLCAAYWAFKFVSTQPIEAKVALPSAAIVVDSKAVAKLLGATDNAVARTTSTQASSKFALFGLVNSASGQGMALIAIDGKPAKPYRVGGVVADDLMLKSIAKTSVILAVSLKAPDGVTLELPARKPGSMVVIAPNLTNPGTTNFGAVNPAAAPAVNTVAAPQTPIVSPVAPNTILPSVPSATPSAGFAGALGAAGLSERAPVVSRFATQSGDMATARQPMATSSSATVDR